MKSRRVASTFPKAHRLRTQNLAQRPPARRPANPTHQSMPNRSPAAPSATVQPPKGPRFFHRKGRRSEGEQVGAKPIRPSRRPPRVPFRFHGARRQRRNEGAPQILDLLSFCPSCEKIRVATGRGQRRRMGLAAQLGGDGRAYPGIRARAASGRRGSGSTVGGCRSGSRRRAVCRRRRRGRLAGRSCSSRSVL
jgi:hypothetical protein